MYVHVKQEILDLEDDGVFGSCEVLAVKPEDEASFPGAPGYDEIKTEYFDDENVLLEHERAASSRREQEIPDFKDGIGLGSCEVLNVKPEVEASFPGTPEYDEIKTEYFDDEKALLEHERAASSASTRREQAHVQSHADVNIHSEGSGDLLSTSMFKAVGESEPFLTSTDKKFFTCDQCSVIFKTMHRLKMHNLIHTCEKPFACNQCSFKCKRKDYLKQHKLMHTGERPFGCNQCSFKCNAKGNLKKHKFIHTGEKPFACDQCSFEFNTKSSLMKHKPIHTGEKPFACDQCSYKTKRRDSLKTHVLRHSSEKTFVCNKCPGTCKLRTEFKCLVLVCAE